MTSHLKERNVESGISGRAERPGISGTTAIHAKIKPKTIPMDPVQITEYALFASTAALLG